MEARVCDQCKRTMIDQSDYCSVILTTKTHANERFDLCPECAEAIKEFIMDHAVIVSKGGIVKK